MASNLIQRPLIFQDENLDVYCKKALTGDKSKSSKQSVVKKAATGLKEAVASENSKSSKQSVAKKGATGLKNRSALNDITNKSSVPPKASQKKSVSQKKKVLVKEDAVNIAEETFLHDHQKCIEAQQAARTVDLWHLVFPERDSLPPIEISDLIPEKSNHHCIDSPRSFPEPEESLMAEFSAWFQSPTKRSPQSSPARCDSPLSSWEFEPVEFKMKEEIDIAI
ncbi:protein PATRONUS 2-like [Ipomoea triloba]|uniref:protein PATRONUS 2-like n=1 Tax=Ipomoea triloba TaxID=35885 RepID=UPI00125E2515|nr:protein PATRONUS 2-like [Ipomoea triloba]XP_031091974.1 protein PATRONUS 2-like [Ipomoea triloba]